ncbi:HAMP domain-containing histidine kinase [Deinococcus sp. 6YEL10]|uniref:sensor histidine kinase n=1 Tax=Deinococcus sp. 6YEL10 TaxID=2745870 RepID=UPI001E5C0D4E|nr:HAMP domain-containing sensor histidine kinase [Deinococcus sp. 6YEL10]MCD0161686.1 HAMP domain-containing histidine kinase [Deinococcus sp. 6YEL10]
MRRAPPATSDLLRLLDQPEQSPIARATVITVVVVVVVDALTPASLPLAAGLAPLLLASLIVRSEWLTSRLTALSVLGSAAVGALDVLRSGPDPQVILLRLSVTVLVLLTGIWATWQARQETVTPAEPLALPVPEADVPPVERAAQMLAYLTGARGHQLHRVENAREWAERQPLVDQVDPDRRRLFRLTGVRVPGPPAAARNVWRTTAGDVFVRLEQPGQRELLVELMRPSAPTAFIEDAAHLLQLQLDRAALVDQVHMQRELLRDLVYAFSHDLRTPITANILHSEAALGGLYGPLSPELAEFLRHSQQGNRDLLTVSDQLMLLAEYESGDLTGEAGGTVDLDGVIRSVVSDVQVRGRERGIHFELDMQPCQVIGHAYDLRRAVQNLLENAMKFSPQGMFVKATLRTQGTLAVVEVMDQGPGVPEEQVPHLFKRFRTSTRGSGTGFGLYLTRRIAERYGGTVTYARSGSDHPWTVFRLCLPLYLPPAPAPH